MTVREYNNQSVPCSYHLAYHVNAIDKAGRNYVGARKTFNIPLLGVSADVESLPPLITWHANEPLSEATESVWIGLAAADDWMQVGQLRKYNAGNLATDPPLMKDRVYCELYSDHTKKRPSPNIGNVQLRPNQRHEEAKAWQQKIHLKLEYKGGARADLDMVFAEAGGTKFTQLGPHLQTIRQLYFPDVSDPKTAQSNLDNSLRTLQVAVESMETAMRVPGTIDKHGKFFNIKMQQGQPATWMPSDFKVGEYAIDIFRNTPSNNQTGPMPANERGRLSRRTPAAQFGAAIGYLHFNLQANGPDSFEFWDKYRYSRPNGLQWPIPDNGTQW